MNVFLIGFMGCGKSTLGKKLAKQLDYFFLDTDFEIEKQNSKSIAEIFETEGEDHFRNLETDLSLRGLLQRVKCLAYL